MTNIAILKKTNRSFSPLLGDTNSLPSATCCLGVLSTNTETPVVPQTSVVPAQSCQIESSSEFNTSSEVMKPLSTQNTSNTTIHIQIINCSKNNFRVILETLLQTPANELLFRLRAIVATMRSIVRNQYVYKFFCHVPAPSPSSGGLHQIGTGWAIRRNSHPKPILLLITIDGIRLQD